MTRIVVGKSRSPSWRRLFRRTLVDDLLRNSREIDIHVIHGVEEPEDKPPPPQAHRVAWRQYARSLAVVALCGLIDAWMFRIDLAEANLVMVFLLGVVFSAARYGRGPGVLASIASVLAFDFFFVPPYLTFVVSDAQYVLTFIVMFAFALLTSALTARIREQAQVSRGRARRTEALYRMGQRLTGQVGIHQISSVAVQQLTALFGGGAAIFLPDAQKRLKLAAGSQAEFALKENEAAVAQWVFTHQKQAGLGTDTLPSADALYLPLIGPQGSVGVLAIRPAEVEQLLSYDQRQLLETFASQIALALEREQLAAQVQSVLVQAETERLRSSLLASVSHDLRTPLAVIAGASSSLLEAEGSLSPETRRELYQTIFDDSHRLSRLVDNLLDMTRIESGSVAVNRQLHVVEELIGSALHRMRKRLAGRPVTTRLPDDLPLAPLDGELVEQVLVNLLENIEKYTPPGSTVEISARQAEGELVVEVADSGPGLSPGDEERVFEKFYRGASAATDGRRGAGLGLAICRAIIAAHGGRIRAENRATGGARFYFSLPLLAAPSERPGTDGAAPSTSVGNGLRPVP